MSVLVREDGFPMLYLQEALYYWGLLWQHTLGRRVGPAFGLLSHVAHAVLERRNLGGRLQIHLVGIIRIEYAGSKAPL